MKKIYIIICIFGLLFGWLEYTVQTNNIDYINKKIQNVNGKIIHIDTLYNKNTTIYDILYMDENRTQKHAIYIDTSNDFYFVNN